MSRPFRFAHAWTLPMTPDAVAVLLTDPAGYPRWWPQVRRARQVDPETAVVRVRSVLPVSLRLTMTRVREDRGAGELGVCLGRDLEGWMTARLERVPGGTRVRWEQEVVLTHPLLRHVAWFPPARWVLRVNHGLMMRAGERHLVSVGHAL